MNEIRNRTQGVDERIPFYISAMENLLNRLTNQVDDKMKLEIIRQNLLPSYQKQLALVKIDSLSELVYYYRLVEDANEKALRFKPPPTNSSMLLEPNLGYKKTRPHNTMAHSLSTPNTASVTICQQPETVQEQRSKPNMTTCWNCKKTGHVARTCKAPPRMHCYRCGAANVTIRTCEEFGKH